MVSSELLKVAGYIAVKTESGKVGGRGRCKSSRMRDILLNFNIAKSKRQHQNIQLFWLCRKGKQHGEYIVNALFVSDTIIYPAIF